MSPADIRLLGRDYDRAVQMKADINVRFFGEFLGGFASRPQLRSYGNAGYCFYDTFFRYSQL